MYGLVSTRVGTTIVARVLPLLVLVFWLSAGQSEAEVLLRRGDANQDARIDVSDAICVLTHLFVGEGPCSATSCQDALDANDDEALDVSDAIYLLAYLFGGGPVLAPPFASCGPDLARGITQFLDCQSYSACETVELPGFSAPEECSTCHPRQYREWSGSMHSYAGISPLFNALEFAGNRLSGGALRPGGAFPLFCIKCHNAVGTALGDIPEPEPDGTIRPAVEHATPLTGRGIQCDVCHFVRESHPDVTVFQREAEGDRPGVANAAFVLEPGVTRFGPLADSVANTAHLSAPGEQGLFGKGDFCAMCHDVRIPGHAENDEPFLRLEDLFTEWEKSPYNNIADPQNLFGRRIACQDCHMSLFPFANPGAFPSGRVAESTGHGETPPVRSRVTTHYFTAVDKALVPFPNQFGDEVDEYGNPAAQDARRRRYLQLAATLSLKETPEDVVVGAEESAVLPVKVTVSNFFTGHRLPSGFSQERQIWIHLEVHGGDGEVLYRSGYLEDRPHPETGESQADGSLADEDLLDKAVVIDPFTGEATVTPGPDRNRRPEAHRGLVSFRNEFLRHDDGGTPDDPSDDTEEEVYVPFLANRIDNTISLAPFEARTYTYDVEVPSGTRGPVSIRARLLFRQFPPYFVRFLAGQLPEYVSEEVVDRLDIVEMASTTQTVTVNGAGEVEISCVDYESDIQPIWDRRCLPCHASVAPFVGLDLSPGASYENLVGEASVMAPNELLVDPGKASVEPGGSFLLNKVMEAEPRVGQPMPAGGALPLSKHELALIRRWIEEGALPSAEDICGD